MAVDNLRAPMLVDRGMTSIFQLIYKSHFVSSQIEQPLAVLRDILRSSNHNNIAAAVTGFLLFDGSTFLQVLEGNDLSVKATFNRILRDPRHSDPRILQSEFAPDRDFTRWIMGGYFKDERDLWIFKARGVGSCRLADVPAASAIGLIKDLAVQGKVISL